VRPHVEASIVEIERDLSFNAFLTPSVFMLRGLEERAELPHRASQPRRATTIALLIGFWSFSCASVAPQTKATEVEQLQCEPSSSDEIEQRLLAGMTVLSVQPIYSLIHNATTGTEKRVSGTKLIIRPPEGIDPPRVLRILQCHSARAVLGHLDRLRYRDDPFWLDGAWLEIDVEPEAGNLAVKVAADDIPKNLAILKRARTFAAAQPGVR
jgi:hypothetical protein